MKFAITATIPTTQYGNLQPSIEVEADTFEEARSIAMPQIQEIWNSVCEQGKELRIRGEAPIGTVEAGELMTCTFSGEQLSLSADHTYTDADGNVYQSGSRFADQFTYEFNKDMILPIYAKKFDVDPKEVDAFWTHKGDNSRNFGNALHGALEVYGKFGSLAEKLSTEEKPVSLGISPVILPAVEDFFADRVDEEALYEVFVVDKQGKRCGQIDRLVKTGDKTCIIEDYKTNGDLYKQGSPKYLKAPFDSKGNTPLLNQPFSVYTIQLNFYRGIMESLGWTVEGLRIHHLDEMWDTIDVPKVDLP